jgi:hypothetical protein
MDTRLCAGTSLVLRSDDTFILRQQLKWMNNIQSHLNGSVVTGPSYLCDALRRVATRFGRKRLGISWKPLLNRGEETRILDLFLYMETVAFHDV